MLGGLAVTDQPKVCVVGDGVIGLATALYLQENGFSVVILSKPLTYRRTSELAAAFWYPYAVAADLDTERELAEPTLNFLLERAVPDESSGVWIVDGHQYFDDTVGKREYSIPGFPKECVPWWYKHSEVKFRKLGNDELPAPSAELGNFVDGWGFRLPVVHMCTFIKWMSDKFTQKHGTIEEEEVQSFQDERTLKDLRNKGYDAVINCSGIWAAHLVDARPLYGRKGVLVYVDRQYAGDKFIFIEHGLSQHRPVYIVPHKIHQTVLGGTIWPATGMGTNIDPMRPAWWTPDPKEIESVLTRCSCIQPKLKDLLGQAASLHATAGLRPVRKDRPPLIEKSERYSKDLLVVHNYGHGGSGLTMCWGSAARVYKILNEYGLASAKPDLQSEGFAGSDRVSG